MDQIQFESGETAISLQGPAGTIEAIITMPALQIQPPAVAIVCHPHSLHGGTMDNKVVTTVVRTFRELHIPAIRFNFRGVGASKGEFAKGIGESEDLIAVSQWVKQQFPQTPIYLAGFSFGSFVAYRCVNRIQAKQLITIALPVQNFDFAPLSLPICPWVVVQGDQDEIVDAEQVLQWLASLMPAPQIIVMEGAGHFFHGKLLELKDRLTTALTL